MVVNLNSYLTWTRSNLSSLARVHDAHFGNYILGDTDILLDVVVLTPQTNGKVCKLCRREDGLGAGKLGCEVGCEMGGEADGEVSLRENSLFDESDEACKRVMLAGLMRDDSPNGFGDDEVMRVLQATDQWYVGKSLQRWKTIRIELSPLSPRRGM